MSAINALPIAYAASNIDRLPSASDVGIGADDVVLTDAAVPGTIIRKDLLDLFERDAATVVEEIIDTHIAVAHEQGEAIVRQMFEDALAKTGEQIRDRYQGRAYEELFDLLDELMHPDRVMKMEFNAFVTPHVPALTMRVFLEGMKNQWRNVQDLIEINKAVLNNENEKAVARVVPRLIQLALCQYGGREKFIASLEANDSYVIFYQTTAFVRVLNEARELAKENIITLTEKLCSDVFNHKNWHID
jgi:hypothetical protein